MATNTTVTQIPFTNDPNQSLTVRVPVNGKNLNLSFYLSFNTMAGYWEMSVSNADTQAVLILNLPVVGGAENTGNILYQFEYLNIGWAYLANLANVSNDYPGENDWGTNFGLFWGSYP